MKFSLILFCTILFACTSPVKEKSNDESLISGDTLKVVENFIYGLWSMDSGNTLFNEGYLFNSDGSVKFVASEREGTWNLCGKDSLKISYAYINESYDSYLKIDSITESRMILTDEEGTHLFRKVPFGMNNEGVVIQGFAGSLGTDDKKNYVIEIPPARKIYLKLKASDDTFFKVYDNEKEITATPLHEWTAIMIRGGKYRLEVFRLAKKNSKAEDFDLKVIAF